jgi:hypothetical protein
MSGRLGDPLRRHPVQGLGKQPDLGRSASAVGSDVGVANLLAAGRSAVDFLSQLLRRMPVHWHCPRDPPHS